MKSLPSLSEDDEKGDDHTSITRSVAMEKRNKRQAASAQKEMKRCCDKAIRNGAAPGAVVTLKVDYRTHSHAQGLIGIVCEVKPTGGINVCCDQGIITHSGGAGVFWVPVDKYVVKAKPDEFCPLTDELYAVRNFVLDGKFDKASSPIISYAKLHEIMICASCPIRKKLQDASARKVSVASNVGEGRNKSAATVGAPVLVTDVSECRWEDFEIRLRMR